MWNKLSERERSTIILLISSMLLIGLYFQMKSKYPNITKGLVEEHYAKINTIKRSEVYAEEIALKDFESKIIKEEPEVITLKTIDKKENKDGWFYLMMLFVLALLTIIKKSTDILIESFIKNRDE